MYLNQAEFIKKYEEICGKDTYAQHFKGDGLVGGLCFYGSNTILINIEGMNTADVVPHEMLHANSSPEWRGYVGSGFNEGTTQILAEIAIAKPGWKTCPNVYPNEKACVGELVESGFDESKLTQCYLNGGAAATIGVYCTSNLTGNWESIREKLEAKEWDAAKALMRPKK